MKNQSSLMKFTILVFLFVFSCFLNLNGSQKINVNSSENFKSIDYNVNVLDSQFVTFSLDTICGQIGDTVCLTMRVNDFIDIAYAGGVISFNPNIVRYVDANSQFMLNFIDLGVGRVWLYGYPQSPTIPNEQEYFKICFEIIGDVGETSPISFYFQLVNNDLIDLYSKNNFGSICIEPPGNLYVSTKYCGSNLNEPNSLLTMKVYSGIAPYSFKITNNDGIEIDSGNIFNEEIETIVENLIPDTYFLQVIDSNQDTFNQEIQILPILPLEFDSINITHTCFDQKNGEIEFSIKDREYNSYHTDWSNFRFNINRIDNLDGGLFGVTVSDPISGCDTDTILEVKAFHFGIDTAIVENASCYNSCDGSIEIETHQNDTFQLEYSWSNGSISKNIDSLCAVTHAIRIRSSCCPFCEFRATIKVDQPEEKFILIDSSRNIISLDSLGAIFISTDSYDYIYEWIGPEEYFNSDEDIDSLVLDGCYTVIALDTITLCSITETICIEKKTNNTYNLEEIRINIYPNPANNLLIINSINSELSNVEISIFDISMNKLLTTKKYSQSNFIKLNLDNFKSGLYFIRINSEEIGSMYKKFIIEN